jgi:molecular chaperone GrpE (heat shock protein)
MTKNKKESEKENGEKNKPGEPEIIVRDKRYWVNDGVVPTDAKKLEERVPSFLDGLKSQLAQKDKKLEEVIVSLKEEQENFKKRVQRDIENQVDQIKMKLLSSILPALENLGRAIESGESTHNFESLLEGIKMVEGQFRDCVRECGAEEIQAVDRPFDPKTDEVVHLVPVKEKEKENFVLACLAPGYRLGDKVIRPAKVSIGKAA